MTYVGLAQKEIKTDYPITEGLTAGTTKQTGKVMNLVPKTRDMVPKRLRVGLE